MFTRGTRTGGPDPVRRTASERQIRCPPWQRREVDARVTGSRIGSKSSPFGWHWMEDEASRPWRMSSTWSGRRWATGCGRPQQVRHLADWPDDVGAGAGPTGAAQCGGGRLGTRQCAADDAFSGDVASDGHVGQPTHAARSAARCQIQLHSVNVWAPAHRPRRSAPWPCASPQAPDSQRTLAAKAVVRHGPSASLVHLPATASVTQFLPFAHQRWAIEQQYQELKTQLGFDHFDGQPLPGW